MKTWNQLLSGLFVLGLLNSCAPSPKDNSANEEFVYQPLEMENVSNISSETNMADNAFIAGSDSLECAQIPSQADVNLGEWSFSDHLYSASQAIKIGIPIIGTSGGYSHDKKVFVKDYKRAALCQSIDKTKQIYYGQLIRTVIEIENYDASIGVDLASIAANGTLNRSTQHCYIYKTGFYNPGVDRIIASISGKVFNVENYFLYNNAMTEILKVLAEPETTFKPQKIGIKEDYLPSADEDLAKAPIIAYSLTCIAKGRSYNDAIQKFTSVEDNKFATGIVSSTYTSLGCSADEKVPNEEVILKAKKFLQGIKVRD